MGWGSSEMEGSLVLEDGTSVRGAFFGARRRILGELVFNTNMTGYTEALTDPSYRGRVHECMVDHQDELSHLGLVDEPYRLG